MKQTAQNTAIWSEILQALEAMLPGASFNTWFSNAELESFDGQTLVVGAANRFVKAWLENNYRSTIVEAARGVIGHAPAVSVVISRRKYRQQVNAQGGGERAGEAADGDGDAAPASVEPVPVAAAGREAGISAQEAGALALPEGQAPRAGLFRSSAHSFESFIAGSANSFARAAAMQAVEYPGEFSPLYIFGGHGLGKTHLLHAICREHSRRNPRASILCITVDYFVQAFAAAHINKRPQEFRARFERCDLLVIDDFQSFAQGKKTASQKELISIIDNLAARKKQVVIAADRAVHSLDELDPMLASRLAAGLQARLNPLDEPTRRAIITARAKELAPEVVDFLSGNASGSVRELEGVIKTVTALARLSGERVDCARAAELLAPQGRAVRPGNPAILAAVAEAFGVTAADIRGKKRSGSIVLARRVAMRLSRRLGGCSLSEIGDYYGGRSHSTVLNVLKTPPGEPEPALCRKIRAALQQLGSTLSPEELLASQSEMFSE